MPVPVTTRANTFWNMAREVACMVLLAAFLFRALVPVGFMPEIGKSGAMQLVVCSGVTHKTVTVDPAGSVPAPQKAVSEMPCGFAVGTAGVEPAQLATVSAPLSVFLATQPAAPQPSAPQWQALSHASRAPPAV